MYVGDGVLYKDEVWYVTEKGGELGIVYSGSGAWGLNAPFVPLSRIDMSQLTDMMGRKVEISKVTYHAKGGTVGDYLYDTRKDKAFQVIMEDGDKMAIQYLDRSKSPIGKAETISKNEFEYYVQMGAWNKWKQEYATGGEITSEEREQGLKKYPKLNF